MKSRLWQRLFLLIVLVGSTGMIAALVAQQWQFERGFLQYLNQLNLQQQEVPVRRLADFYREQGNWESLRGNRRKFDAVMTGRTYSANEFGGPPDKSRFPQSWGGDKSSSGPNSNRAGKSDDGWPRDPNGFGMDGPKGPPPEAGGTAMDRPPPPPSFRDGDKTKGPPMPPPEGQTRLALLDATGQRVVGSRDLAQESPALPIMLDDKLVGHLMVGTLPALKRGVDIEFAQAQGRNALVIGAGVIVLAFISAWLLARSLLHPVTSLAAGTRSLAKGEYDVRIPDSRTDELGDLARDFNSLAAALHDNRAARRRWGADISHELRTPLAILGGELQAMHDGIRPLTQDALDSLRSECQRLTDLVEDLFQLSLSDAGALEYRRSQTDLAAVIRSSAEAHLHAMEEKGLALTVNLQPESGMWVLGDERRLTQLLANLFTNSGRYTDAPGRIVISTGRISDAEDMWRILFEDTSPGVAAEHLPRLFERLYRVENSRNREAGGAGLGLSIAQSIVEAHGGRISASASPLGGLQVCILIPVDRAAVEQHRGRFGRALEEK